MRTWRGGTRRASYTSIIILYTFRAVNTGVRVDLINLVKIHEWITPACRQAGTEVTNHREWVNARDDQRVLQ